MSTYSFEAVIFDLDGVITQTALVHSEAWKQMFDEYLRLREKRNSEAFKEFTHRHDYLTYIDGKPRYEGVESFLQSRGIHLPYGDPADSSDMETVCGLGNRKNRVFNEVLAHSKVKIYITTVNLINELKENNIKVGVASSSKNCKAVLEAAGLLDLFETRVDGVVSAELKLKGKPEPDIFTTACGNLGVSSDRAVIVEDSVSGVQAGIRGNFSLVLGIAREKNEQELKINGADIVVRDIGEIDIDTIEEWFLSGLEEDIWSLSYFDYPKKKERIRESLCTIGNGYFGTRGAAEECDANKINYPGTYIAGVYNRLESQIAGRRVINEDLVNCPNWLSITFRAGRDEWFDLNKCEIISFFQRLDFKRGILNRRIVARDSKGRETLIESSRLASMDNPHIASLRYSITPINYSDDIWVKSGLNGNIINSGVERYKQLNSRHLKLVAQGGEDNVSYLLVQTNQSQIKIAEASKIIVFKNGKKLNPEITLSKTDRAVYSNFGLRAKQGDTICIEKIVAIYTSKDQDIENPLKKAEEAIENIKSFKAVARNSEKSWSEIWEKIDIKIQGNRLVQKLIRLDLYHLMATASAHNAYIDAGIPARGLHGEAYRGHIFWDELFILPFYNMHFQDTAKSILLYRYQRLDEARKYAREYGFEGAMFPWQSGSDGREETPMIHLNPMSGKWGDDYSSLQRHVSLAIAYNIWQYYWTTNDLVFLEEYGAELFLEICRFWAGKSVLNEETDRYEIKDVMGPDEFHEKYADSEEGGLKDNSYTNIIVVWAFNKAFEILNLLNDNAKEKISIKFGLTEDELDKWRDIIRRMNLVISDQGIIAHYDGYFGLKELEWEKYKKRFAQYRMDRILKAEGKSPDEYKVSKQADTLMVFYNLSSHEVKNIINELGYTIREDFLQANFDYYFKRTSHGSSLSKIVHSYLARLIGYKELGYELFEGALQTDYIDTQGGTTGEGIHTGAMAGSVLLVLYSFVGLDMRTEEVKINPCLPGSWRKVSFNFDFRGDTYNFEVTHEAVKAKINSAESKTIKILIHDEELSINTGQWDKYYYNK